MSPIVVSPINPADFDLEELCDDITEYASFVQRRTGLTGQELFDATRAEYGKICSVSWNELTWRVDVKKPEPTAQDVADRQEAIRRILDSYEAEPNASED